MKYYAVRKGNNPGIYNTWDECKKEINGFSGAEYKKFSNLEEAKQFINGIESNPNDQLDLTVPNAFVDGSYDSETDMVGAGFIILLPNKKEIKVSFYNNNIDNGRNVVGELQATISAILNCKQKGYKKVIIHHDYKGISEWALGNWKAKKDLTKEYKRLIEELSKDIDIEFIKVKAHSGHKYNDIADSLANEGIQKYKSEHGLV
jgi:ribonuclease HI